MASQSRAFQQASELRIGGLGTVRKTLSTHDFRLPDIRPFSPLPEQWRYQAPQAPYQDGLMVAEEIRPPHLGLSSSPEWTKPVRHLRDAKSMPRLRTSSANILNRDEYVKAIPSTLRAGPPPAVSGVSAERNQQEAEAKKHLVNASRGSWHDGSRRLDGEAYRAWPAPPNIGPYTQRVQSGKPTKASPQATSGLMVSKWAASQSQLQQVVELPGSPFSPISLRRSSAADPYGDSARRRQSSLAVSPVELPSSESRHPPSELPGGIPFEHHQMPSNFDHNELPYISNANAPRADSEFAAFNFSDDSSPSHSPISPTTPRTPRYYASSSSYFAQTKHQDPANVPIRIPFVPDMNHSEEHVDCLSSASSKSKSSSASRKSAKAEKGMEPGEGVSLTLMIKPPQERRKSKAAKMWNKMTGRGPKFVM